MKKYIFKTILIFTGLIFLVSPVFATSVATEETTEVGQKILQKLEVNPSLASKIVGNLDGIGLDEIDNILSTASRFEGEIDIQYLKTHFGDDIFKNVDDLDDAVGYGRIDPCVTGRSVGILDILFPVVHACGVRPKPKESEEFAKTGGYISDGAESQLSFVRNELGRLETVPYGTKGSSRPDYISPDRKLIEEVKNYDINKNLSGLKQNIKNQMQKRFEVFGNDITQKYLIDIRYQTLPEGMTDDLLRIDISNATGLSLENVIIIK